MQLTCMCVLTDYGISEWKNGRNIMLFQYFISGHFLPAVVMSEMLK